MAKKSKGIQFETPIIVPGRCIAFDTNGIPWIIDPDKGYVQPADIRMPATEPKRNGKN